MSRPFPRKICIGLTGSIASGKSTALAYFGKLGAATWSADALVRQLYSRASVRKQLLAWFGSADPAQIAPHVFTNAAKRKKLEDFLHPQVWKLAAAQIKACRQPCCVLEVPLLFEAGWETRFDLTVLVVGEAASLAARLQARGLTRAEYNRRLRTQLPQAEKVNRADICLVNGGSPGGLEKQVAQLYRALAQIYHF